MPRPRLRIASVGLILTFFSPAYAQLKYDIIKFSGPLAQADFQSQAIDNRGGFVGTSRANPQARGFIWRNSQITRLPAISGTCSYGNGINAFTGHIAGMSCLSGDMVHHATIWRNLQPTDIDTFNDILSNAEAINNKDEVAGSFFPADGSGHGFFWSNGHWSDVGSLGGMFTFGFGINDSDLVVGQSDTTTIPDPTFGIPPFHAFAWQAGTLTDFGPLFSSNFNYATQVDPSGNVVGTSDVANDTAAHGFIWNQGVVTDLGTLPGDQVSWAIAENNVGAAVGSSGLVDPFQGDGPPVYAMQCPCKAVLWQNGQILDLNTAVPKQWQISLAFAISDTGEIVAEAMLPKVEKVVLKPAAHGTYSVNEDETQLPSSPTATPRMLRRDPQGTITAVW